MTVAKNETRRPNVVYFLFNNQGSMGLRTTPRLLQTADSLETVRSSQITSDELQFYIWLSQKEKYHCPRFHNVF